MATVQVIFGKASISGIPVPQGGFSSNEIITSGATTDPTTISAAQGDDVVGITNTGGNVYINIGGTPVAVADDTSILILDGERIHFGVNPGDKVAVIDA